MYNGVGSGDNQTNKGYIFLCVQKSIICHCEAASGWGKPASACYDIDSSLVLMADSLYTIYVCIHRV